MTQDTTADLGSNGLFALSEQLTVIHRLLVTENPSGQSDLLTQPTAVTGGRITPPPAPGGGAEWHWD